MGNSLSSRLSAAIEKSRAKGQYRYLENSSGAQGVNLAIGDRQYLNFCSNDYLGLCNHPVLKQAVSDSVERYGVGAGAAQLLSGRHDVHEQLENELAEFTGYEAALIFSSGYLANIGLISALVSRHDVVHQDKLNHASLIDAIKLSGAATKRYPHVDMAALERGLGSHRDRQQWIITDSVFSMDGDLAPLSEISELARLNTATLIVDDAHGIGVLARGQGARAHFGLSAETLPVVVVTFGKALGTQGAAILGERTLIDFLVQTCRTYIYDTAPPPAITAATSAALAIIRDDPNYNLRLMQNIDYFKSLCARRGISPIPSDTPIQPVIFGEEQRALDAAAYLREQGIYLRAVRPPTVPPGTARLRICLSAGHKADDIERLVSGLVEVQNRVH